MAAFDGHDEQPSGREPTAARSALTLRLVLAVFGLLVAVVGAAAAWWLTDPRLPALAVVLLGLAAFAAVNIAVVARRIKQRASSTRAMTTVPGRRAPTSRRPGHRSTSGPSSGQ